MQGYRLQRIGDLSGDLLTCVKQDKNGRCMKYIQTCDGDDCITESPAHPDVPGRKKGRGQEKKKRKAKAKPAATKKAKPKARAVVPGKLVNPEQWELDHPPELLAPPKTRTTDLKSGEYNYLVSNRMKRKDPGTDFVVIRGEPIEVSGLEFMELFVHKSQSIPGKLTVSEVTSGKAVIHGTAKKDILKNIQELVDNVKLDPALYRNALETGRKIVDYPHLKTPFIRLYTQLPGSLQRDSSLGHLSGDLLTCSRWIITGKGSTAKIRCGSFKRTCLPGDVDCAPAEGKKERAVSDAADWEKKILHAIATESLTVDEIADKLFLAPGFISDVVAKLEKENRLLLNETQGDIVVITPKGKTSAGIKIETTEEGLAPFLKKEPFTKAQTEAYRKHVGNPNYSINGEFRRTIENREKIIAQEMINRRVEEMPWPVNRELTEYKRTLYNLYKLYPTNPGRQEELLKNLREQQAKLDLSISEIRRPPPSTGKRADTNKDRIVLLLETAPGKMHIDQIGKTLDLEAYDVSAALVSLELEGKVQQSAGKLFMIKSLPRKEPVVTPPEPEPDPEPVAEPPEKPWRTEHPFSKEATDRYNAYTFHPIDDLNDDFHDTIRPKLDLVKERMKKYGIKEIPEEVEVALDWYRRRTYEYLQRMIYSRLNAPGTFIVGASNYNTKKHQKTIAGDQKYRDNLDVSGRKLDTAIKKHLLVKETGKKRVAVSDRDKWESIAVTTKRTKFGNMTLADYLERAKTDEKVKLATKNLNLEDPKSTFRSVIRAEGRNVHAKLVEDAHERGVTIAPEVLAEYPDLARPKIVLSDDDPKSAWARTKWTAWEKQRPPILLNTENDISDSQAYLVQDRQQRRGKDPGYDYTIVKGVPIQFVGAGKIPLILHNSVKTPGTWDISHVPTGALLTSQRNPLNTKSSFIRSAEKYIAQGPAAFLGRMDKLSRKRITLHYPHLYDLWHNLNVAKTGKRKPIDAAAVDSKDWGAMDLSGIGSALQAINAVYSLTSLLGA